MEQDAAAYSISTRRYRRGALLVTAATLAAAAGVPVLFHPSLDGSPPEHDVDPPPPLLLAETSPPVAPAPFPSTVPAGTGGRTVTSGPPVATPTTSTGPAGPSSPGSSQPALRAPMSEGGSLEAEGPEAVRSGSAAPRPLAGASAGSVVGFIGNGSANKVRFPAVRVSTAGAYTVVFHYTSPERRRAMITVNGQSTTHRFPATDGAVGWLAVRVYLTSDLNVIEYGNPRAWAPDLDRIVITG